MCLLSGLEQRHDRTRWVSLFCSAQPGVESGVQISGWREGLLKSHFGAWTIHFSHQIVCKLHLKLMLIKIESLGMLGVITNPQSMFPPGQSKCFANAAAMFLFLLPALYGAVQFCSLSRVRPQRQRLTWDEAWSKPLRQVDIGMPILLISFEKFAFNQMFLGKTGRTQKMGVAGWCFGKYDKMIEYPENPST